MNEKIPLEQIKELRILAKKKLSALEDLLPKSEYEYFLDVTMMEIGNDIGIPYKAKFLLDIQTYFLKNKEI